MRVYIVNPVFLCIVNGNNEAIGGGQLKVGRLYVSGIALCFERYMSQEQGAKNKDVLFHRDICGTVKFTNIVLNLPVLTPDKMVIIVITLESSLKGEVSWCSLELKWKQQ